MTEYRWPTTKERSMRATAQFRRRWRCEWCGQTVMYSGGWQMAQHKQHCKLRRAHLPRPKMPKKATRY